MLECGELNNVAGCEHIAVKITSKIASQSKVAQPVPWPDPKMVKRSVEDKQFDVLEPKNRK